MSPDYPLITCTVLLLGTSTNRENLVEINFILKLPSLLPLPKLIATAPGEIEIEDILEWIANLAVDEGA
ncbi:hypothetical protein IEQ34_011617 [Dendrobium chrysotoxum]|uniref:Uncharacterized protein n=1 Tax=Dendrobium chrysotoxum TaxID=161865 RepID=A0AAV7GSY5_DENCH|nr:hypothetical protein IEQ34_011617 [Dendrobium chrysotoxum]